MTHGIELLQSPSVRRIAALGALTVLVSSGAYALLRPANTRYVATLEATSSPCAIYFSAWDEGAVVLAHDGSDGKPVTFRRSFVWVDGCTWESEERLEPIAANRYFYRYNEHFVSCPKGRTPSAITTPRVGVVTLSTVDGALDATAFTGSLPGFCGAESITTIGPLPLVDDDESVDELVVDDETSEDQ